MKSSATPTAPPASCNLGASSGRLADFVVVLFGIACVATLLNQFYPFWPDQTRIHGAVLVAAMAASIAALTRTLAWLNVLLAGGLAGLIGGFAHAISSAIGMPFGHFEFTAAAGPNVLGLIPWWLPGAWAIMALSSRGTARFILAKSRNHPAHGYQVILLATGLAVLSTVALQTFVLQGERYGKSSPDDSGLPLLGHGLHLFIQVAITPLLIEKFPGPRPPNFRPLLVLAGANAVMLAALLAR